MKWTSYNEIENSDRTKYVQSILEIHHSHEAYVTEKIHGANLSFHVTENDISLGKRSGIMNDEEIEGFYSSKNVYEKYKPFAHLLFLELKNFNPMIDEITVYGELFGGSYDHPEVLKTKDIKVQKGISYCPHEDFLAFDIKIHCGDDSSRYLHPQEMVHFCELVSFPFIPILFKGTLKECFEIDPHAPSEIYKIYGLPELENNEREGIVINAILHYLINTDTVGL